MKTIPAALAAHFQGETLTLALCWLIEKRNGEFVRGTDHDRDLTIPGGSPTTPIDGTYYARAAITGSDRKMSSDLSVDNMEVQGAIDVEFDLTVADIESGVFDGARVTVMIVNWRVPSQGFVILSRGYLGELARDSDARYKTEIRGLAQKLTQSVGDVYSERCNVVRFGDERCKFDVATITHEGGVLTVTDRKSFTLGFGSPDAGMQGFLPQGGEVTFSTGANAGFTREIKTATYALGVLSIELYDELPDDAEIGDAASFIPGCDRRYTTCKLYDNLVNFRGYGVFVPGVLAIMRGPNPGECLLVAPDGPITAPDGTVTPPPTPPLPPPDIPPGGGAGGGSGGGSTGGGSTGGGGGGGPLTGDVLFDQYSAFITAEGGTPVSLSHTRFWSALPPIPTSGTIYASTAALNNAAKVAAPFTHLRLANGIYRSSQHGDIVINRPDISVGPQTHGQVYFDGVGVQMRGDRETCYGFLFVDTARPSAYIQSWGDDNVITRNLFENAEGNPTNGTISLVAIKSGTRWRVCFNDLGSRHSSGQYLHVQNPTDIPTYGRCDHNVFDDANDPSTPLGDSDCEFIQYGQSQNGVDYFPLTDGNYFKNWRATRESEIVTVKCAGSIWIGNYGEGCRGHWNLRAARTSYWFGNFFKGTNSELQGGISVYGRGHVILCSYFDSLNTGFVERRAGIIFNNGASQNDYERAEDVEVSFCSFVNMRPAFTIGTDGSAGNADILPRNLSLYNNAGKRPANSGASIAELNGATVASAVADAAGNVMAMTTGGDLGAGNTDAEAQLVLSHGYYVPQGGGNCDGTGAAGFSPLALYDITGRAMPGSGWNVGAIQPGYNFASFDPIQDIKNGAGCALGAP